MRRLKAAAMLVEIGTGRQFEKRKRIATSGEVQALNRFAAKVRVHQKLACVGAIEARKVEPA